MPSFTSRNYRVLNFFIICSTYFIWVYLEQKYLREPLYNLSLDHIKVFRNHAATHNIFDQMATLISQMGDKSGIVATALISYTFSNEAHSFICGTNAFTFVLFS